MMPRSKTFQDITLPERVWLLLNIYRDQSLENQKFEALLQSINPFSSKEEDEGLTVSTEFINEVEESLGRKLTEEEFELLQSGADVDFVQ